MIRRGLKFFFQHTPLWRSVAFWILHEHWGPFVVASFLASSGVLAPLVGLEQVSLIVFLCEFEKIILKKRGGGGFSMLQVGPFNTLGLCFVKFFLRKQQ